MSRKQASRYSGAEPYGSLPGRADRQAVLTSEARARWPTATMYVNCTRLMRTSRYGLWARLRQLLTQHGLVPADTILVHLFPDGANSEYGTVVSDGGRVYSFDLHYNREDVRTQRTAVIERWLDITDRWQGEPFSREIAETFIWRPPPRRTSLTEPASTLLNVDDTARAG